VWIRPGESVHMPVRPIAGGRVLSGTSGVVEGALDDPVVRDQALATLRSCGYLDVVDGRHVGDAGAADAAVPALMILRRTRPDGP
jgi:hypothetical protein